MEAGCALARMGGAGGVIHAFIIAGYAGGQKNCNCRHLQVAQDYNIQQAWRYIPRGKGQINCNEEQQHANSTGAT